MPASEHLAIDVVEDARQQLAAIAACRIERPCDDLGTQGMDQFEREVLQLAEQLVEPSRLAIGA